MFDITPPTHHIQKYIVGILMFQKLARFRDLRPPGTDTNLFSYHLKLLIKQNMIVKLDSGYSLSQKGMTYVDRVSSAKLVVRSQPKVITMLVVQNSDGDILLQKRTKQPYIDTWTLPYGKVHIDDTTIMHAAQREASEKLGLSDQQLIHAGDCYIRVVTPPEILSSTLAHIFTLYSDGIEPTEAVQWVRPHKLAQYPLAPAVERIVARTFFRDVHFFEEFEEAWTE